jgi:transcriptional regulator with XRE-family HTH domain
MKFGEMLRKLREAAGLSQEALARKGDFSISNVRNYEQGRGLPSFPVVVKLADALNVSCEVFKECEDVAASEPEKPAPKKKGGK